MGGGAWPFLVGKLDSLFPPSHVERPSPSFPPSPRPILSRHRAPWGFRRGRSGASLNPGSACEVSSRREYEQLLTAFFYLFRRDGSSRGQSRSGYKTPPRPPAFGGSSLAKTLPDLQEARRLAPTSTRRIANVATVAKASSRYSGSAPRRPLSRPARGSVRTAMKLLALFTASMC